jgi:hypothetical protein
MFVERIDDRFDIAKLVVPRQDTCSEPGCDESHLARFVLFDHKLKARVGFETHEDALEHIENLPSRREDSRASRSPRERGGRVVRLVGRREVVALVG